MEDFKIACMNGIEYTNLETFLDDLDSNNDCTHGCRYKWKYTDIVERMLGERIE